MKKTSALLLLALMAALSGCNADCASPFEKPDASAEPVNCQAQGCAE